MDMRRAGMVFVAAALLVVLLALGAFAQTAGTMDQSTTSVSATTTTGTTTAPAVCPPGTAGTAAMGTTGAMAGQTTATAAVTTTTAVPPITDYASLWNSGGMKSYTGRIVSVDEFYPGGPGSAPGLEVTLALTPEDTESIPDWQLQEQPAFRVVQLGPAWFVQQNVRLHAGQLMTVTGIPAVWHGQRVIIARDIAVSGHRYAFRNNVGYPMWAGAWQGWGQPVVATTTIGLYNPSTVQTVNGKIEHVWNAEPAAGMGRMQMFSIRQADNTVLSVAAAPASFVQQSGIPLKIGDQVSVTGSLVTAPSGPLLLASQIQEGGTQYTLRDINGNPAWAIAALPAMPVASATAGGVGTSASASASIGQPGSALPSGASNQPAAGAAQPGPQANAGIEAY